MRNDSREGVLGRHQYLVNVSRIPSRGQGFVGSVGDSWSVATNGAALVCVANPNLGLGPLDTTPKNAEFCQGVIDAPASGTEVTLALLRGFIGSKPQPDPNCAECHGKTTTECSGCDGTGQVTCECMSCGDEHDTDCDNCGGDGLEQCSSCVPPITSEPGWILGRPFDRGLLRQIVPDWFGSGDTVAIDVKSAGKPARASEGEAALWLFGAGWRAVVKPLRCDERHPGEPALILPEAVAR